MFRFTIRDLLWLMVVVALASVWWAERAAMKNERAALTAERYSLKAKRRKLDVKFLELVDSQDRLNNELQVLINRRQ
jgi:hypothetical protein